MKHDAECWKINGYENQKKLNLQNKKKNIHAEIHK